LDAEKVRARIQYLRDTIGQKLPTHNKVGMGVVGRKRISIQGFWHNSEELRARPIPAEIELRARRNREYSLASVRDELGMAGVIRITQRLLAAQDEAQANALAAMPKVERTRATE
jgi:hypothetical protein